MITAPVLNIPIRMPDPERKAVLVVSLGNFDVCYASPLAIEWLGLPSDRLLGRSIMLSLPLVGQALTLAVSGGLSEAPTSLGVPMATPSGLRLLVSAHRADTDAIIDFVVADEHPGSAETTTTPPRSANPIPDAIGLQRRLVEMKQDLATLRGRIPCTEAMLRGEDPMLFWLWQAEGALTQISQRFAALCVAHRKGTAAVRRPTTL